MSFVSSYTKKIRTFTVDLSEDEMKILLDLLGDAPTDLSVTRNSAYSLYQEFKEAWEDED